VLAALALTGLTEHVTITWVRNIKGPAGWEISPGDDPLFAETSMKRVYERLEPGANHRPSVPLLVDLSPHTLLSTSSPQMTRFFVRGMNGAYSVDRDLAPDDLVEQIDDLNAWLHDNVNRAVYAVGFASEQRDYEKKVTKLFQSLDELESRLTEQPFLLGNAVTESDLYMLATLVRFDTIYYPLFRCTYRRIADYPALSRYLRRLEKLEGISATFDHALNKQHYFCSVMHVGDEVLDFNPSRLVPVDSRMYERAALVPSKWREHERHA
jgi:putative glutathione S-transferase